jgi:hypothetical protein
VSPKKCGASRYPLISQNLFDMDIEKYSMKFDKQYAIVNEFSIAI